MTDDDAMLRSLRDAARPGLAPGGAERIADGAWERAAVLRSGGVPWFRIARRAGWAVAAAIVAGAAVVELRGTDPAFAVEGDPVNVERAGEWVATRTVAIGTVVEVP